MTETTEPDQSAQPDKPRKRPGGLNGMLLADLKAMAGGMGIAGAGSMKKAQLVEAIKSAQAGSSPSADRPPREEAQRGRPRRDPDQPTLDEATTEQPTQDRPRRDRPKQDPPTQEQPSQEQPSQEQPSQEQPAQGQEKQERVKRDRPKQGKQDQPQEGTQDQGAQDQPRQGKQDQPQQGKQDQGAQDQPRQDQPDHGDRGQDDGGQDDGEGRTGRNRRRRGRDRNRAGGQQGPGSGQQGGQQQGGQSQGSQQGSGQHGGGQQGGQQGGGQQGGHGGQGQRHEPDTTILEDDVVVPAAGILDVLDNYAFVRTSGYLPGPDDVYLSLSMVRRFGLRRGDALVGQVRHPREGERREKFNPMVRIDSVNGQDPETAKTRADFTKLTPLFPSERLRLETGAGDVLGRVVDLAAPLGKGQRGLVLAPADAGKTTLLRSVAASISANHADCHLMVVLVDERPEEVTEFERSVKGEVIASTFDRPPADHVTVAELAIERARRLVELGHDVVVLLDGLTRLGRAYHQTVAASGRALGTGGLEPAALHPPKRFFGAARNVENGGSLTILATAQADTGFPTDEAFLEALQGTANHVVHLDGDLAAQSLWPAVDLGRSGTRREELLLGEGEREVLARLRSSVADLAPAKALTTVLDRVRGTQSNIELLSRKA
ncbi:transcription termination factor Rho [Nocardioides litoris]|uniref:transcription termination factor Rho n=1 Tax=Nocardioides litoris TaxID=1926648 RepID=UPI0011215EF3|nr:transcription termination factor Rho [Nocardioides litoris]